MLGEFFNTLGETWNWIVAQLGFSDITWFHVLFIVLAFLGALSLLRRLAGSGSRSVGYPSGRVDSGLPPKFYLGDSRLSDFSIPKEVYRFGAPTPKIDTSKLTEPLKPNMSLARELFTASLNKPINLNWDLARKLFVPSQVDQQGDASGGTGEEGNVST